MGGRTIAGVSVRLEDQHIDFPGCTAWVNGAGELVVERPGQAPAASFAPGRWIGFIRYPAEATPDVEAIARVSHEVNRAWCAFNGDDSQPAWADAPDWQRQSAIAGVRFHLANPDAGDAASHESWLAEKVADGWQWGPRKDPAAKRHPCMVPFDELPREQQFKDRLFRTVVHAAVGSAA